MIDLHCHVLPGIDDGAADLAEAVAMCRLAAADGVEVLVATPHQRTPSWENLDPEGLAALRARLAEAVGGRPELLAGAEVRVDSELLDDLARPGLGGIVPLAGSRCLLLEIDRTDPRPPVEELAHELALAGWTPIFAHPEFIPALGDDLALLHRLAEGGALFQVTAMCVSGEAGAAARARCHRLLDEGLVHFVASDSHGVDWRPPGLARARSVLAARWGEETAQALTADNPRAVIEHRPLAVAAPARR
jgi:protein-tyrosine phosphatase